MNLFFNITEHKSNPKPRRLAYRRKVATKAKTKLLINTLRHTEFINAQQADVLLALLGVAS
ncbi:MAG: hypothetical protein KBA75_06870 [Alphaproteobacteria bacterium]|nr:hypothetical protein [Alphaproteobacteria bacterium]